MPCLKIITRVLLLAVVVLQGGCAKSVEPKVYDDVPSGFLLGPEDELEITVWKNQDLTRETKIRPDGHISLPVIGDVKAAGLTADELAKQIAERLQRYLPSTPSVSVAVKELNSYSIYVVGEVQKPGKYPLKSYVTVLQAISTAGGFTDYAKRNSLMVVRVSKNGDGKRHEVHIPLRYDDLVAGSGEASNIVLHSGDTLVVP